MYSFFRRLRAFASYGLPWSLLPARSAVESLRRHSFAERYRHLSPGKRFMYALATSAAYPFATALNLPGSWKQMKELYPEASPMQVFPMAALALLRNVPPTEYARYGFHHAVRRAASAEYLYWTDIPSLLYLNRLRGANNADVQDKGRFAALCRDAGLPHVRPLAVFRGGEQVEGAPILKVGGTDDAGRTDLWVKPLHRNAGYGARGWKRDDRGSFVSGDKRLSPEAFLTYLCSDDCMVQQRLTNHADLSSLTNGSVAVFRLLTACDAKGQATLLQAGVALPTGKSETTRGAVGCSISMAEGKITLAGQRGGITVTTHPDTGVALPGQRIPMWQAMVELALRAHSSTFGRFASLGWDVVLTPDGPLLLEANSGWSVVSYQTQHGPLGRSALGAIIAEALHGRAA